LTIAYNPGWTGSELKKHIATITGMPEDLFYLTYGCKYIREGTELRMFGIEPNSNILMNGRILGGLRCRIGGAARSAMAAAATCKCMKKASCSTCYHRDMMDGSKPFPYKFTTKKRDDTYKIISWNASIRELMSCWKEVEQADWDCLIMQETQHWSDDCLKWIDSVIAHTNVLTSKAASVRLMGRSEPHGNFGEDFGMMTIFKKGQVPKLKKRHPHVIVSSVSNGSGDSLTLINVYWPQWAARNNIPLDQASFEAMEEGQKAKVQQIIDIINEELAEAHHMKRAVIIAGDFNQPFHRKKYDSTDPDTRTWVIEQMFKGHFAYKVPMTTEDGESNPWTFWRGLEGDVDGKGHTAVDAFFVNEWAMASTDGQAVALTPAGEKRRDHRPIQLEWDMKVMTKVREGVRKWRSEPHPMDWTDKKFVAEKKEDITDKTLKAIEDAQTAHELWQAVHRIYEEDYPRRTRGKTGTRLPGESSNMVLKKRALKDAFKAKDQEQIKELKAQIEKLNSSWLEDMQENVKKASKHDQRFLSEAMKGEHRSQSRIYALKDDGGRLRTDKPGVHEALKKSWTKIFTANATTLTQEFEDTFLSLLEKIDTRHIAALEQEFTKEEVEATLADMRADASALDLPSEMFVKERKKLSAAIAAFFNRLRHKGGAEGLLNAEILLLPKTEDEFDPVLRRPIVIAQVIARCLTKILDARLRRCLPNIMQQGGFKSEASAEDIAAALNMVLEHARRLGIDVQIFITDWERMYDSIALWLPIAMLRRQGVPEDILKLIDTIIRCRTVKFRTAFGCTEEIQPTVGLAQGDPLSCILAINVVNLVVLAICRKMEGIALQDKEGKASINLKMLAYVDDCTILPKDREELMKVIQIFEDWERMTGMKLKPHKCKWILWPARSSQRDAAAKGQTKLEDRDMVLERPKKCKFCDSKEVVSRRAVRGDPSRLDPSILAKRWDWSCNTCNKWWKADCKWSKRAQQQQVKEQIKPKQQDSQPVPFHGKHLEAKEEAFKLLGVLFDPRDQLAHITQKITSAVNKIERIRNLPWAPAEAIAKLEEYVVSDVTYGALAYNNEGMLGRFDELQLQFDKAARAQAGRSICKEVLYDGVQNGGVGVPHIRSRIQMARINTALRMFNSVDTVCSEIIRHNIWHFSKNIKYGGGHKPKEKELPVENTAPFEIKKMSGYRKSDVSVEICSALRAFKVKMLIATSVKVDQWIPKAEEYHPEVNELLKKVCKATDSGQRVVLGSDGGLLVRSDTPSVITGGIAALTRQAGAKERITSVGMKFTGNATSHYAEAIAMEGMLYIATQLRVKNGNMDILMYSDSESNVNSVNLVAGGAPVSATNTQPTRTRRMASLLKASEGQLR